MVIVGAEFVMALAVVEVESAGQWRLD